MGTAGKALRYFPRYPKKQPPVRVKRVVMRRELWERLGKIFQGKRLSRPKGEIKKGKNGRHHQV